MTRKSVRSNKSIIFNSKFYLFEEKCSGTAFKIRFLSIGVVSVVSDIGF